MNINWTGLNSASGEAFRAFLTACIYLPMAAFFLQSLSARGDDAAVLLEKSQKLAEEPGHAAEALKLVKQAELRGKREALTVFHQEFEISRAFETAQGTQAFKSR